MSATLQARRFARAEARLQHSPLVAQGGAVVTSLLDGPHLAALTRDAFAVHPRATEQRIDSAGDEIETRGDPDRWLESAPGGPPLQDFYDSTAVHQLLAQLTGLTWTTAGGLGTFSYYRRRGHHLGLHRDLDICDLAVITCVYDDGDENGASGRLCLYPSRTSESLASIRKNPKGGVAVRLRPGQSLILLGGLIPHRLLPMSNGHTRIVSPLCYQLAG